MKQNYETNKETVTTNTILFSIVLIIFALFLLSILFGGFYTISAGYKGVLLTFGKVTETSINEGIHAKIPFVQTIIKTDVRTQKYEADASAASKDLQTVSAKIAVNYHVIPERVVELYKEIGLNYGDTIIQPSVQEVVKAITAKFAAEDLINRRQEVKEQILQQLKERLNPRSLVIEDVSITNFDFSSSFNQAIEQKVVQEQQALAAQNKLRQIEFEAQQRVASAQAEAEAIRIQAQSINSQGGKDYVALKAIEKWDGQLPKQMIPGAVLPFINVGELQK